MKIAITIATLLLLTAPASAKVWIWQWSANSFDVRETRGLWDYPIAVDVKTEREAREIAGEIVRKNRGGEAMNDLDLIKQAIARTAAQEELGSKDRALLDRMLQNIADLEKKRAGK
jgi:L-rhamnose isomerase